MAKSQATLAVILIIVIAVASFAFFAGWTYPRTILTVPVSLTIGADVTNTIFNQPVFDGKTQVSVNVESGTSLWLARIFDGSQVLWQHTSAQGEQTSYNSGWIDLPSGQYNFTFSTIGGALSAKVSLVSKGGFW